MRNNRKVKIDLKQCFPQPKSLHFKNALSMNYEVNNIMKNAYISKIMSKNTNFIFVSINYCARMFGVWNIWQQKLG